MLAFKARCSGEEVRWRGRRLDQLDSFGENAFRAMLGKMNCQGTSLWDTIWGPLQKAQALPGFDPEEINEKCKQFLEKARSRSLEFKTWGKGLSREKLGDFLEFKESFFEHLPKTAEEKFAETIDDSFATKYESVKGLIDRHNGENVDVQMSGALRWKLVPLATRFLLKLPKQFELGGNYSEPTLTRYDMNVLWQHMAEVSASCRWKTSEASLRPDFEHQVNRLVVPCQGTQYYCWVRSGRVISLGELFLQLHQHCTAYAIYELYLHLAIVSIKRKKVPPKCKSKTWA